MSILLYCGRGVSRHSSKETQKALKGYPIFQVNKTNLAIGLKKAQLLVIPGGRDVPYHEALQGKLNQAIREFVMNGGSYLGICAGGYYGAAFVEFEKGNPLEVIGPRELAFFPDKAVGPVYDKGVFEYNSETGSRIAKLKWREKVINTYYNGGCCFKNAYQYKDVEIIATYEDLPDNPAAIVRCKVGAGQAILSGVHPEVQIMPSDKTMITNYTSDLFMEMVNTLMK